MSKLWPRLQLYLLPSRASGDRHTGHRSTADPQHEVTRHVRDRSVRWHREAELGQRQPSLLRGISINVNQGNNSNRNSDQFQRAQRACQHYLPGAGSGGTS